MSKHYTTKHACQVCHKDFPAVDLMPATMVRGAVVERIRPDCPEWSADGFICVNDLNHYRTLYVEHVLTEQRGELSNLETEVVRSLKEHELLTENVEDQFESDMSFGGRLADKVASFGGSWTFLSCFMAFLAVWIIINSVAILLRPFDPYPFIFLNLMLSCLAAIQPPVIMMSQNRQESKDRVRAEHDYRINLKAELEIRHLHAKLDLLLTHQWQKLLEIQEIQMELMQESHNGNKP